MQSNIRIIELLRFLYQQTDEAHAVTVYEMIEYLKSKGSAVLSKARCWWM